MVDTYVLQEECVSIVMKRSFPRNVTFIAFPLSYKNFTLSSPDLFSMHLYRVILKNPYA